MHKVKVQGQLKDRHCMEYRRHNGQVVTVLREWGNDALLVRGADQGKREYDIIPKSWIVDA